MRRHRRSVCQSAVSLPQAFQASRQSLMGHHGVKILDNRKKIDFKQTIIDFQEKTILTSLKMKITQVDSRSVSPDVVCEMRSGQASTSDRSATYWP